MDPSWVTVYYSLTQIYGDACRCLQAELSVVGESKRCRREEYFSRRIFGPQPWNFMVVFVNGCSMKKTSQTLQRNYCGIEVWTILEWWTEANHFQTVSQMQMFPGLTWRWPYVCHGKPWETMGNHDWLGGMINQSDGTSWMAFYSLKLETVT